MEYSPGTSTEEDFLEDEEEAELLAEEKRQLERQEKRNERKRSKAQARHSIIFKTLRWPLLLFCLGIIFFDLCLYFIVRHIISWVEFVFIYFTKRKTLMYRMKVSKSYSQWKVAANALDEYLNLDDWKRENESPHYDFQLLQKIVRRLRRFRKRNNPESVRDVMKLLKHTG